MVGPTPSASETTGAPVAGPPSFLLDAEETAVVLAARRARRRVRQAFRFGRALFVVLFVSAVIASMALPGAVGMGCRGKQSEAKGNLRALYVAMQSYFAERDTFTDDLQAIGFAPTARRYRIVVTDLVSDPRGASSYVAWAFADPALDASLGGDVWSANHEGTLTQVADGCRE